MQHADPMGPPLSYHAPPPDWYSGGNVPARPPQPCSVPNRRGFVGERKGVQHPESRGQRPKCGHGDSRDTWPLPSKGRGTLPKGAAGIETWDAGEVEAGKFASGGAALCSNSWTMEVCVGPPAHTHLCREQRAARLGSWSDPAPAQKDENTTRCLQVPSHAVAAGTGCRTSLEVANFSQSPNRSYCRGRTGWVSGTGEPARSQSQPTTAAAFPGSQHTGRHQNPLLIKTRAQAGKSP